MSQLLQAYTKIHSHLTSCGSKPVLSILDNKAPGQLKDFMKRAACITFQLVPPHAHRQNAAERAISAHLERSFYFHFEKHRSKFPSPSVVLTHQTASHHHSESPPSLGYQSETLC
jgi:hypothetical protein